MRYVLILVLFLASVAGASPTSFDEDWNALEGTSVSKVEAPRPSNREVKFVISPFNFEKRIEAQTNPVLEGRDTLNLAAGIRYRRHLVSIEYSQFGVRSGNATYGVDRKFQDYLGWYRYSFIGTEEWRGVIGAGAGVYEETVTTNFFEETDTTSTGYKWTAATGLGAEFQPWENVLFLMETRLISGANLDPNPNLSFLGRLSFQF